MMVSARIVAECHGPKQIERVVVQVAIAPRHYRVQWNEDEGPVAVGRLQSIQVVSLQALHALAERQVFQCGQSEENDADAEGHQSEQVHTETQVKSGVAPQGVLWDGRTAELQVRHYLR